MLLTVKKVDNDWYRVKAYASRNTVLRFYYEEYKVDQVVHIDDVEGALNAMVWHFERSLDPSELWAGNLYIKTDLDQVVSIMRRLLDPEMEHHSIVQRGEAVSIRFHPLYNERL